MASDKADINVLTIQAPFFEDKSPNTCIFRDGTKDRFFCLGSKGVKGGTKVSNVVDFAKKSFDSNEHSSVVWSGSGSGGVTKTISCAEIMKRDYKLHQVTRLCYRKVEEYWEPQLIGLEQIVATRQVPCIHILLSLDKIEENVLGHQNSTEKTTFWVDHPQKSSNSNFYKGNKGQHRPIRSKNKKSNANSSKSVAKN